VLVDHGEPLLTSWEVVTSPLVDTTGGTVVPLVEPGPVLLSFVVVPTTVVPDVSSPLLALSTASPGPHPSAHTIHATHRASIDHRLPWRHVTAFDLLRARLLAHPGGVPRPRVIGAARLHAHPPAIWGVCIG
jgi:hypothetical protein